MVFYGRVLGVYSLWNKVAPLVLGFENNLHKGYKSREEIEQAYSQFMPQQAGYYVHPQVEVEEPPAKIARRGKEAA